MEKWISLFLSIFSFSCMCVLTVNFFLMGLYALGGVIGLITAGLSIFIWHDYRRLNP